MRIKWDRKIRFPTFLPLKWIAICTKLFERKRRWLLTNEVELLQMNLSEREWSRMPENEIVCILFEIETSILTSNKWLKNHSQIWITKAPLTLCTKVHWLVVAHELYYFIFVLCRYGFLTKIKRKWRGTPLKNSNFIFSESVTLS